jgi:hypothetical protein
MVIPDTQVKDGESTDHFTWAGKYAVEMQPDVIVHLGDHWDMTSLSSYDKGKGSMEGKRYLKDIDAGNHAMERFITPIMAEQKRQAKKKKKQWKPRLVFLYGNHEERIERAIDEDLRLEGVIGYHDFQSLPAYGWEEHDFLKVVTIDGVSYSHYFTSGVMGRPVTSARALLTKKHQSCVMGHVQQRDIAFASRADGTRMTGWILHDVQDGQFDEMPVSLNYLEKKYGKL